jgi:glycosyltransferase involved in cell wall biosynthesis
MFVDRLERLIDDADLRRQFERAAQATVDDKYSWEAIAQRR